MNEKAVRFLDIRSHGFVRVAVAIPEVHLGDPMWNGQEHARHLSELGYRRGVAYVIFPELGLSGYSCGDLFHNTTLQKACLETLGILVSSFQEMPVVSTVGMPLMVGNSLYNVAVTFYNGRILGVVPKVYPPEYREFYEKRHFSRGVALPFDTVEICGQKVPFGTDLIFSSAANPFFVLHTEICEDLWVPIPPSAKAALAGATVLGNLSASNITIGKTNYREMLVASSSAKNIAVQLYGAAGFGESTTDMAWDGYGLIAERGTILKYSDRFSLSGGMIVSDVDLETLVGERSRQSSFNDNAVDAPLKFRVVCFSGDLGVKVPRDEKTHFFFERETEPHPFVPKDPSTLDERCRETFLIQATSLARRLSHMPKDNRKVVIGVSGGRDSAHALLVAVHAMDLLELPRTNIIGLTMPGFGTTSKTKNLALKLMRVLGVTHRTISIKKHAAVLLRSIGHDLDEEDLTFENVQAWTRKIVELAVACKEKGIDVGAGDLSELMLGWTTMFGDHASHYGINAGVPKTLISFIIDWAAKNTFDDDPRVSRVLFGILKEPVSPELLKSREGEISQKTEEIIGPYELHDFFGYYFVRFGMRPQKIARMAFSAFCGKYQLGEIKKWLGVFISRFFVSQFKRNCLPDGPKVGLTCLSPRGDFRMPSDMNPQIWLDDVREIPDSL